MANILFKRGLHQALPTSGNVVDGAFYLTTDSHRLYAGIGTDLVDLNQYINVVDNYDALAALKDVQDRDFAYIVKDNILAIYQADKKSSVHSGWVQVNAQAAQITNSSLTVAGSAIESNSNDVNLKVSVKDSNGSTVSDTLKLLGVNGKFSVDKDGNITFTGKSYSLSGGDVSDNTFSINLTDNDGKTSFITLKGDSNISIQKDAVNGAYKFSAEDTTLADGAVGLTVDGGSLTVNVSDSGGNSISGTATKQFYYTYGGDENNKQTAFNQSDLKVYTIDEIDKKFKGLNPMCYKGTISSSTDFNQKTSVSIGDTYMASGSFMLNTNLFVANSTLPSSCKIGDLFIATGTELDTGYIDMDTLKWTYIPAGDDSQTDTTYTGTANKDFHSLTLKDSNLTTAAKISLVGDDKITLTSVVDGSGKELTTTISHADPGDEDENKKVSAAEKILTETTAENVITNVVVDDTGHVKSFTTTPIKVKYELSNTVTKEETIDVFNIKNILKDSDGTATSTQIKLDVSANDSLKATFDENNNTIKLSLEWGSF